MKSIKGASILFAASIVLAGCSMSETGYQHTYEGGTVLEDDDGYHTDQYYSGTDEAAAAIEAADWDNARVVDVTFYQDEVRPMIIHLKKGEPYKFRFINRDKDTTHGVRGTEFFKTVAPKALVNGEEELKSDFLLAFELPAEETREYHFIPGMDGRFELDNAYPGIFLPRVAWAPWGKHNTHGMTVTVYVEE